MTNGRRSDLNCDGHDHEDDHHGEAEREAEAREGRAHQLHLADEVELDVARARVALERLLEVGRDAADVAPLGLHEHVRGALELVALDGDGPDASGGSSP